MTGSNSNWQFATWVKGPELATSLRELLTGAPRSATVLAGSLLDDLLARLIDSSLVNAPPGAAPASELDYSTKCVSAREMGVISDKMLEELRGLGRIRNEFAHNPSPTLDFNSTEISRSVERLKGPEQVARQYHVAGVGSGVRDALEKRLPMKATGHRYWWAVSVIAAIAILGVRLEATRARRINA